MRRPVDRGMIFGEASWQQRAANRMGVQPTSRPRGGPVQSTTRGALLADLGFPPPVPLCNMDASIPSSGWCGQVGRIPLHSEDCLKGRKRLRASHFLQEGLDVR